MNSGVQMIFPLSRSIQGRRLLLRNGTDCGFVVKLVPSSSSLISFHPLSGNQRAIYYVEPNSSVSVKVSLDQSRLFDELQREGLKQLQVIIYCTKPIVPEKSMRDWLDASVNAESELVERYSIVCSKAFSALEVVVDLPGKAHFVNAVSRPSLDVDDSDCLTAHRVESDTRTAVPLSDNELLETLPPDSMLDTCRPVPSPYFSTGFCPWMTQAMSLVFPPPTVIVKSSGVTPPYAEVDCIEEESGKQKKV